MHNDVVVDIRVVYYRGRYRADTGWSKTGMGGVVPNPPAVEVEEGWPQEAVPRSQETASRMQLIA